MPLKFNMGKCLQLGFRVHWQGPGQGRPKIGILADQKLTLSPCCAPAALRANAVLLTAVEPQASGRRRERPAGAGPGRSSPGPCAQFCLEPRATFSGEVWI